MFKDISDRFPPYEPRDVSKERISADSAAVLERIETEVNMKHTSQNNISNISENELIRNEEPQVLYPRRRSPLRVIIPAAAAAAVIAAAVPIGINMFGKKPAILSAASGNAVSSAAEQDPAHSASTPFITNTDELIDTDEWGTAFFYGEPAPGTPANDSSLTRVALTEEQSDMIRELLSGSHGWAIDHEKNVMADIRVDAALALPDEEADGIYFLNFNENLIYHSCVLEPGVNSYCVIPEEKMQMIKGLMNSGSREVPEMEALLALSDEEASEKLRGISAEELTAAWGEPTGQLSGFYGLIWSCDGKEMIVYFDADSRAENVKLFEQTAGIPTLPMITAMSESEATSALKGFSAEEIREAWNDSADMYNNFLGSGLSWCFDSKEIIVYFSEGKACLVRIYDRDDGNAAQSVSARKVFDCRFDDGKQFTIPEVGRWYFFERGLIRNAADITLTEGAPVKSVFIADLNGDGMREICAELCVGSGIIDHRIYVYDVINAEHYELADRQNHNYELYINGGELWVNIYDSSDFDDPDAKPETRKLEMSMLSKKETD